ncbi:MAG: hypothetical protein BJ554DRAFT_6515 [Olpidium bornovanus]|uniref:Uncharacterized protein n=1 Tax=Olpidium bornovanus TaxID=278681 RepID=A0A8H7ZXV5_9FUNG|nr:MAG: hypothetical protein BJ554DRAFT_6515 [Olpidium bornovanus]
MTTRNKGTSNSNKVIYSTPFCTALRGRRKGLIYACVAGTRSCYDPVSRMGWDGKSEEITIYEQTAVKSTYAIRLGKKTLRRTTLCPSNLLGGRLAVTKPGAEATHAISVIL